MTNIFISKGKNQKAPKTLIGISVQFLIIEMTNKEKQKD